jgi:large subunit ribosomal protein L31
MRTEIHPEVHETTVVCSGCQAEYKTHSTLENIRIEICSNCHPFYTGKQSRIIDTEGRVERFVKKFQGMEARVSKRKRKMASREADVAALVEREKNKDAEEKAAREEARLRRRGEQAVIKAARDAEEAKLQATAPVAKVPPAGSTMPDVAQEPGSEAPAPEASSESTEQS